MALQISGNHPPSRRFSRRFKWFGSLVAGTAAIALSFSTNPVYAADPFRAGDQHDIGENTEAAFEAIFKYGNYTEARQYLVAAEESEADEPMVHAMLASMAYLDKNWEELGERAELTRATGEQLIEADPLRGHIYTAVGIFLEGAYVVTTQGIARGTPTALRKLQQVFSHFDQAERISENDPELSLVKGYMDLLLAVNLPFSNPEKAINYLDTHGYPAYIAQRGIALGYRDLGQYDEAIDAVDRAIQEAPDNPELYYLKAQIYSNQDRDDESLELYTKSLEYEDQLPQRLVKQIRFEHCLAEGNEGHVCSDRVDWD